MSLYRGDEVSGTGTSVEDLISGKVNRTGDTMTGDLTTVNLTAADVTASGTIIGLEAKIGNVGTEGSGINIGGTTYESSFKVSDIDGTNYAQTILHRHSTTLEPLIVGARSNSNTTAHTDVSTGQNLFTVYAAGWAGSNYKLFGSQSFGVDSAGTVSNTSAPGVYSLKLTPDGSTTLNEVLNIDSKGIMKARIAEVNVGYSNTVSLTNADCGKTVTLSGTTYTATLPAANAVRDGARLTLKCTASGDITITRASTDTILMPMYSTTSFVVRKGDSITLISDGVSEWKCTIIHAERDEFKKQDLGDFDLSWLITKDGNNVVITGDSISFNRYDFTAAPATNDAYACLPGLMSWSFMLRDFIHRSDPWFVHADCLDYISALGGSISSFDNATAYSIPFNGRYVAVSGTGSTSTVEFMFETQNEQTNKVTLYCTNNTSGDDGKVDVYYSFYPYTATTLAGTITTGGRTNYQGLEPFTFDVAYGAPSDYPVKIIFTNFRNNDGTAPGSARRLFLNAAGTKKTNVYLTGHGGWQASELYADFTNRIGQYNPDLLVMIVGANDRFYATKEAYATNLINIINATKALKPYCKIIILSGPRASNAGYGIDEVLNGSTMREFLEHAKAAVLNADALWFDTYSLTSGIDPAVWRYDNTHLTKRGNKILFDALIGKYFSAAPSDRKYYDPLVIADASNPSFYNDGPRPIRGDVRVTYDNGTQLYTISTNYDPHSAILSVTRINAYTMRVTMNYNIGSAFANGKRISIPSVSHYGASGVFVVPRVYAAGAYSVDYVLYEALGNALITDVQNNAQVYSISF